MSGDGRFVSRGGLKLECALDAFAIDVSGLRCADLGCNVGGFTDCLLRRGAARVYAVDTGYGSLAWALRTDDRVVVMERTNALHVEPPERVGLVVIDLGWTPQRHALPAAARWLEPGGSIVSLIKPHYELSEDERRRHLHAGELDERVAADVRARVVEEIAAAGFRVLAEVLSPIRGGKSGRNVEWLVHLDGGARVQGERV